MEVTCHCCLWRTWAPFRHQSESSLAGERLPLQWVELELCVLLLLLLLLLLLFYWETQQANCGLITGNPKYFINCCLNEWREKVGDLRGEGSLREFQRREVVNNGEILREQRVTWGMHRDVTDWERVVHWVLFSGVLSPYCIVAMTELQPLFIMVVRPLEALKLTWFVACMPVPSLLCQIFSLSQISLSLRVSLSSISFLEKKKNMSWSIEQEIQEEIQ